MTRAQKKLRVARRMQYKPGFIVAIEFSATGGVTYQRDNVREEQIGEKGLEAEFVTVKRVDNVDLHKESKAIIGAAYYVMDRACVNTPLGYYADEKQLEEARAQLADVQQAAQTFNEMAALLGSARRVTIEIYPLELQLANEHAARRLAKVVRERLISIRDALAAGNRKEFESVFEKARNLERLATGIQADSVRLALDVAKERKSELLEALRNGADPAQTGAALDLEALQAAINLFSDPGDVVSTDEAAAVTT